MYQNLPLSWIRILFAAVIVLLLPLIFAVVPINEADAQAADQATVQATGRVHDNNFQPVPGALIFIDEDPSIKAITADDGSFTLIGIPAGLVHFSTLTNGGCYMPLRLGMTIVSGTVFVWMPVGNNYDSAGHYCQIEAPGYIEAGTVLPLTGPDSVISVSLPFEFQFYNASYTTAYVSSNGFLNFLKPSTSDLPPPMPSPDGPNAIVAPFLTHILFTAGTSVRAELIGSAPDRKFIIEWRGVALSDSPSSILDFETILWEDGTIQMEYRNIDNNPYETGGVAKIGIWNGNKSMVSAFILRFPADAIRFGINHKPVLSGFVTDANDGLPIAGAMVGAYQEQIGLATGTYTQRDGSYYLPLDSRYHMAASSPYYQTTSPYITVDLRPPAPDLTLNFALKAAAGNVSPEVLKFDLLKGNIETKTLTLTNDGSVEMTWEAQSVPNWLAVNPTSGTLAPGIKQTLEVTADSTNLTPGSYPTTLTIKTNSPRQPDFTVSIDLQVREFSIGVNAGGKAYTSVDGAYWRADQRYKAGSWGYINGSSRAGKTKESIAGTTDPLIYQTLRQSPGEYRFDDIPAGTYEVELFFAEWTSRAPNTRVFDILIEGQTVLANHDIASEVGKNTADHHAFTVLVTDGQLNIRLVARKGSAPPVICGILITRVTE